MSVSFMRRVIYAWNYVEWGGAQIHFLALAREARQEFETIFVLPERTDRQFLGFLESEGIRYELFPGHIDTAARTGVLKKLRRHWIRGKTEYAMLRAIERVGVNDSIVHTNILPGQSLLSLVWLCARAHVFLTMHNALGPVPWWRWMLWKVKFGAISRFGTFHVFCTNHHAKQYFQRLFLDPVANDIKITYDSIDPVAIERTLNDPFDRNALRERFSLPPDKFIVLAVGQFVDRKGRWVFLEAAKKVTKKKPDMIFIWVAPNLPSDSDKEKVDSFGLGENFRLLRSEDIGPGRKDILTFFRVADIYALPSFIEGLPISLLEAMAIGLPSISTDVYGIPEAIIHEETGLLIEAGDPAALAESIERLVGDAELRQELSRTGRDYVIERFDERIAAVTAVEAYKATLTFQ